jgi:hypothetical protein
MTFDLPNKSCAGQREEVPDKGYSTGYFMFWKVKQLCQDIEASGKSCSEIAFLTFL